MSHEMDSRWLRWGLTAVVVLLAIIALELWGLMGSVTPRAHAQIPDSGLQRKQLLDAQSETNAILERILQHLRTQTIKVTLAGTDKETKQPTVVPPRATNPQK